MTTIDLEDVYDKLANQLGITKKLVKEIVNDLFARLRNHLRNPKHAAYLLNYFGAIEVKEKEIVKILNKTSLMLDERLHFEELLSKIKEYNNDVSEV